MAEQRYKVLERVGAGGMAEVFKANSTSMQGFEKLVAIKRILPNLTQNERFVRMFLDEAKVSLHINHTNCVQVFDLGVADGSYFIVMEFVHGTDLKKLLKFLNKHNQPMRLEDAVFIAIEVCKGLTHAHNKTDQQGESLDIVHRDISPPNILISKAGEVKITDFGLAKAKSQAENTDPGVVKGKFGYLSPEAAQGEDIDPRTDIFAVGILLWEMLAGRRLFLGESDHDTLMQVRNTDIPSICDLRSDVPPQLEAVLERTLTQNPDNRFQTARQLGRALAQFLFDNGRVVTAYDIGELIEQFEQQRPQRRTTQQDKAAGKAVQRQLDQLKSLEEIDDLDMYLAEHYESLPDQGEVRENPGGNFEDPRMWADLGFGGDDREQSMEDSTPSAMSPTDSDSWQETGLDDLAASTSSQENIDALEKEAQPEQTRSAPSPEPAGPPTIPGGSPGPGNGNPPTAQQGSPQQRSSRQPAPSQQPQPSNRRPQDQPPPQQGQPPPQQGQPPPQQGQPPPQQNRPPQAKQKGTQQPSPVADSTPETSDSSTDRPSIPASNAEDPTKVSPVVVTVVVAVLVVIVGAGFGFLFGILPP